MAEQVYSADSDADDGYLPILSDVPRSPSFDANKGRLSK